MKRYYKDDRTIEIRQTQAEYWDRFLCLCLGEDNGTFFKYPQLMNYMNNDSIDDSLKLLTTHLLVHGIYHPENRAQMIKTIKEVLRGQPIGIPLISAQYLGKKYQSWEEWRENNMTDEWEVLIKEVAKVQKEQDILNKTVFKAQRNLSEHRDKLQTIYDEDRTDYLILESEKMGYHNQFHLEEEE